VLPVTADRLNPVDAEETTTRAAEITEPDGS
jgi:hypothetical protein